MMAMREIVLAFLTEAQWPVQQTEAPGGSIVETRFRGNSGEWRLLAEVRENESVLAVYSILDVVVEPEQMAALTELITRINFDRPLGNFDLDYETGVISYRTGVDLSGSSLTAAMAENLVYVNGLTMDRYLPAIVEVLFAGGQPDLVLEKLESSLACQDH
ncbi:MAG TPA: YbjN domain-containing protein [Patescibacteria group bacterium]|nr:YbjN domain-containing protein [Patescibacteria group bacterium]